MVQLTKMNGLTFTALFQIHLACRRDTDITDSTRSQASGDQKIHTNCCTRFSQKMANMHNLSLATQKLHEIKKIQYEVFKLKTGKSHVKQHRLASDSRGVQVRGLPCVLSQALRWSTQILSYLE